MKWVPASLNLVFNLENLNFSVNFVLGSFFFFLIGVFVLLIYNFFLHR